MHAIVSIAGNGTLATFAEQPSTPLLEQHEREPLPIKLISLLERFLKTPQHAASNLSLVQDISPLVLVDCFEKN
jgi:hypothetical protein